MPGRNASSDDYRYGFQSQEIDQEWLGGAVSFKYRVHDARLGRFLSIDPLASMYPYNSPFAFAENKMGLGNELEGLELGEFIIMAGIRGDKVALIGYKSGLEYHLFGGVLVDMGQQIYQAKSNLYSGDIHRVKGGGEQIVGFERMIQMSNWKRAENAITLLNSGDREAMAEEQVHITMELVGTMLGLEGVVSMEASMARGQTFKGRASSGNLLYELGEFEIRAIDESMLSEIDGLTETGTKVAKAIRDKSADGMIMGGRIYDDYSGSPRSLGGQYNNQILVRSGSGEELSTLVHEGQHYLDEMVYQRESTWGPVGMEYVSSLETICLGEKGNF